VDGQPKRRVVRSFVSLSVVSVRGVRPTGERTAMLHRNLRGGEDKNPDQPINFVQLIIRKIIRIIATNVTF